jgi:hypothetical protein
MAALAMVPAPWAFRQVFYPISRTNNDIKKAHSAISMTSLPWQDQNLLMWRTGSTAYRKSQPECGDPRQDRQQV